MALASAESERSFSPAMSWPPARWRERRFSAEAKPRSVTQTTRPSFQARRSSLTCRMRAWSAVLPGRVQNQIGIPSLVTANPMTTWGRSDR